MRVCIVEDKAVTDLEPLTLTRPAFELILGASSLEDKIARTFGCDRSPVLRGSIVRPQLAAVLRERDPNAAINDRDWLARGPVLVANGRWVPPADFQAPDSAALGWASATASPPAPGSAPGRPSPSNCTVSTPGSTRWRPSSTCVELGGEWIDSALGPGRQERRPPGPRLRRPPAARGQQPPPRPTLALVGPGRAAVHPRVGTDRPLHRLRHHRRPDHHRAAGAGSSRSPGSRAPATSAATPSCSAPTSAAA